jgi:hypothetical protein
MVLASCLYEAIFFIQRIMLSSDARSKPDRDPAILRYSPAVKNTSLYNLKDTGSQGAPAFTQVVEILSSSDDRYIGTTL